MKKNNFLLAFFFVIFFSLQSIKADEAKMIQGLEISMKLQDVQVATF